MSVLCSNKKVIPESVTNGSETTGLKLFGFKPNKVKNVL